MIEKRRGTTVDKRAKVVSSTALSTPRAIRQNRARSSKPPGISLPVDLYRRASVVRQNFRNCRRKLLHAGARHDDAVAATMSFLGDAQEFPAIVLTELHIEMLALNLQFFRLDDVIHFPGGADSTATDLRNGSKILGFFYSFREMVGLGS
jgi:hypothetical protein